MAPKNRVIIDTDPGIDDILALLLALSTPANDLEVLLISLVRGNVDVHSCLRNAVALFHTLEAELAFRHAHRDSLPSARFSQQSQSQSTAETPAKGTTGLGFDGITAYTPLIAIGADEPLQDPLESDFFHGRDGLAGIHASHPHLSPQGEWAALFREEAAVGERDDAVAEAARGETPTSNADAKGNGQGAYHSFAPSLRPAHEEILRLLRENEPGTISLIAIGPLTNFAVAAAQDPETFLRAKQVVVMGGTVGKHGNVTPVAEFNVYADPAAAARVFALSGPRPASVLPEPGYAGLKPYPEEGLGKQARVVMLGLDVTERHVLRRGLWEERVKRWKELGSPLAVWMSAFMGEMLDKMERLGEGPAIQLHDPMCVWYVLTEGVKEGWKASHERGWEDVRVECRSLWTRGMTVGDVRPRQRRNSDGERTYDHGNWLGGNSGNRIVRIVDSPGEDLPGQLIMDQLFG